MSDTFLNWICPSGHEVEKVQMGVSTSGEVLAKWRCDRCNKEIIGRTTVAGLLKKETEPKARIKPVEKIKHSKEFTPEDWVFLYDMKISALPPEPSSE